MKAIWNGQTIAQSDATIIVEGNHYFPPDAVDKRFLEASAKTTVCGWKGTANYYSLVVGDDKNQDAAWYYADPKAKADNIRNYVAFWRGVRVEE